MTGNPQLESRQFLAQGEGGEGDEKSGDAAGWLEFGRSPEKLACEAEPLLKLVRPRPGLMVLFPSYFYHRTVPFRSEEKRISIAFDALPAVGKGGAP